MTFLKADIPGFNISNAGISIFILIQMMTKNVKNRCFQETEIPFSFADLTRFFPSGKDDSICTGKEISSILTQKKNYGDYFFWC
jgi:hypothetical protein